MEDRSPVKDATFIPGLELSRGFFFDLVEPVFKRGFPNQLYSAALIGDGSEVLGFDTPMSADHHWGPRVMLFLRPEDYEAHREKIRIHLGHNLPPSYRGYPTNYTAPDPRDHGVQNLAAPSGTFINHRAELFTINGFFRSYFNLCISEPLTAEDWLSVPSQKLRSVTAGGIFHDDLSLGAARDRFAWYPQDVWLYMLGCSWIRIGQEEHLMARAGSVNDEAGSAVIGARLVREIMRIAFLLEREYPPSTSSPARPGFARIWKPLSTLGRGRNESPGSHPRTRPSRRFNAQAGWLTVRLGK